MSTQPILFFQLLANQKLDPGALLLQLSQGDHRALPPLIADHRFVTLAKSFPCVIDTEQANELSPDLLKAIQDAGCRLTQESALYTPPADTKPALALNAEWLAGDWYLDPPQKVSAGQAASHSLSLKLLQLVSAEAAVRESAVRYQ